MRRSTSISGHVLERAERSLYRAARREAPDPSAQERTLEALQRAALVSHATWDEPSGSAASEPTPIWRRSGWLLAFAAAIAVLALAIDRRAPGRITASGDIVGDVPAARSGAAPFASPPDAPEALEPPTATAALPVATAVIAAPQPPMANPSKRSARAAPSLSMEVEALDRARAALAQHDPRRALVMLDDYDRVLGGARLRDEAILLRIEALQSSGRGAEAAALARRFVVENPDSPFDDRARRLVDAGSPEQATAPKASP